MASSSFRILPAFSLIAVSVLAAAGTSQWVYFGPDHKLRYRTDGRGNRIMDFSFAGFQAGGVKLPTAPVAKTLSPVTGDNTAQIQSAIDAVSHLPLTAEGLRGAVLLRPGSFDVAGAVTISASGVVLRGSGSGDGGTAIRLTGSPHRFLEIRGSGTWDAVADSARITDAYVPSGADSFHVDKAAGSHVGDSVLVRRPVTDAWIHFMHMDTLVRDGKQQTWIKAGSFIRTDRVIRSISGNLIALDVPLSDSIDSQFLNPPGATVVRYAFPGRISQAGVESLRIAAPTQDVPITDKQYTALMMDAVIDGWAKDIAIQETQNGIVIGAGAKRVTLDSVRIVHTVPHSGSAAPADFSLSGTQIFLSRCSVRGEGTWPIVTQAQVTGPIVVLNFTSDERGVAPHQRWATGLLVDSSQLSNSTERTPGIAFSNRKTAGSGHGWDIGWAVAWNVTSPFLLVEQPPGTMNWAIGCTGKPVSAGEPSGIFDSPNSPVAPASLYLEQLRERLGQ
ncbi:conserved exported hypothetical protein [Candidatus Sulfopaludibacter sp. SbA4]|nr:conserved exported hypothetical protein [Candidatus Sulfopaludibacter sp. SbA4]